MMANVEEVVSTCHRKVKHESREDEGGPRLVVSSDKCAGDEDGRKGVLVHFGGRCWASTDSL